MGGVGGAILYLVICILYTISITNDKLGVERNT